MKFITLEGVDGAGKSSHIEFIADAVRTKAPHVIVTREPGGTDLAERLRQVILAEPLTPILETLLIFAARSDHAQAAHPGLAPDRTLVFDCPYDIAAARLAKAGRKLDRFEREDRAFYERVRSAYLELARAEPPRMRIIDASRSAGEVREQITAALASL